MKKTHRFSAPLITLHFLSASLDSLNESFDGGQIRGIGIMFCCFLVEGLWEY